MLHSASSEQAVVIPDTRANANALRTWHVLVGYRCLIRLFLTFPPPAVAPSRKGCVVNGGMTMASKQQMSTPPRYPAHALFLFAQRVRHAYCSLTINTFIIELWFVNLFVRASVPVCQYNQHLHLPTPRIYVPGTSMIRV